VFKISLRQKNIRNRTEKFFVFVSGHSYYGKRRAPKLSLMRFGKSHIKRGSPTNFFLIIQQPRRRKIEFPPENKTLNYNTAK
jgi:hypothetical protein